jgi:hypothetical protein
MVYKPADDDVRAVATFVATFVAMTVAFGTTAPVLSLTVPEMVPSPAVCAFNAIGNATANRKSALHSVFAGLPWNMLSLEYILRFMMTSIEISSVVNCPV